MLQVVFEDDAVQVCCEADLISKIAVHFWHHNRIGSEGVNADAPCVLSVLSAVKALCATGFELLDDKVSESDNVTVDQRLLPFSSTVYSACRDALLLLREETIRFSPFSLDLNTRREKFNHSIFSMDKLLPTEVPDFVHGGDGLLPLERRHRSRLLLEVFKTITTSCN